jgi:RNA polymerase sigma-70 factor (ECF subfamily)
MVFRFVLSLSGDRQIAEDVTQETFERAFRSYGKFSGRCAVSTWLCQIAKNAYFAHSRREKRYVFTDEPPTAPAPDGVLWEKERALQTHRALHKMREPYKEVLTLRVFGELDYAEIAALFEKSESWARVTFYRAKGMLREMMEVDSDE